MKKIILLFFLFTSALFAQESNDKIVYLDSLNRETSIENHFYYKVIKDYNLEKSEYKFLTYFKTGNLHQEGFTVSKDGEELTGEIIFYYKNGNKQNSTFFNNARPLGKVEKWYENGSKSEEGEFTGEDWSSGKAYKTNQFWDEKNNHLVIDGNGLYTKSDSYYNESGSLKNGYKDGVWSGNGIKINTSFTEIYQDGSFVSGKSKEEDGTEHEYNTLEVKPEPKKGIQDFYKHIGNEFTYTRASIKNKIKGKIIVKFVVDRNGDIVEVQIVEGLGYGLDEEAIRVVSSYKKGWTPGLQKGRTVRCQYQIPIKLAGYE